MSPVPISIYSGIAGMKVHSSYQVCPSTVRMLRACVAKHGQQTYQIRNTGGHNCAGWACLIIQCAGLKPPADPSTPNLGLGL